MFLNCEALKTVIFEGTKHPVIDLKAFAQSSDTAGNDITHYYPAGLKIYVPDASVSDYETAFENIRLYEASKSGSYESNPEKKLQILPMSQYRK